MTRVAAIDCGTNSIRLLVADVDPATGALPTCDRADGDRPAGPGRGPHRPARPRGAGAHLRPALPEYAGTHRGRSARSGSGSSPPPPPGTPRTRDEFVARWSRQVLGVEPEVITGDEEAELSFTGATRSCPAWHDPLPAWSTSAAARPSSCSARRSPRSCRRAQRRHRLRPDDRAASARRPADRGPDAAALADIDAALDRPPRRTCRCAGAAPWSGWPARSPRWPRIALDLPAYDPDAIHRSVIASGRSARSPTGCCDAPRRAGRAAGHAPRPGRRDRRRARWCCAP